MKGGSSTDVSTMVDGGKTVDARFMEVEWVIHEIPRRNEALRVVSRDEGDFVARNQKRNARKIVLEII